MLVSSVIAFSQISNISYKSLNTSVNLLDIHISADGQTGYAVGSRGSLGLETSVILKTIDGGESGWQALSYPGHNTSLLRGVAFIDELTGFVVGTNGRISKTTDGGETWVHKTSNTNATLNKVYFVDDNIGYAVGEGAQAIVVKTIDGGESWVNKSFGIQSYIRSVFFIDADTGWISGAKGFNEQIWYTEDGGNTWVEQSLPDFGNPVNQYCEVSDIVFVSETTGWATVTALFTPQKGFLLHTTDGGNTWEINKVTGAVYNYNIVAKDENHIAFTSNDFIFSHTHKITYTEDGGQTWTTTGDNFPIRRLIFCFAWIGDKMWIGGDHSAIFSTNDNGLSFDLEYSSIPLNTITWINETDGYVSGGSPHSDIDKIYKTTDGGETWLHEESFPGGKDVFFIDENYGWTLNMETAVVVNRTVDGGQTWTSSTLDAETSNKNMTFICANNGFLYGPQGDIFKTTDGGQTWSGPQNLGTTNFVEKILFIDQNIGFAVGGFGGSNGFVSKTIDGGANWNTVTISEHVRAIYMLDSQTGWVTGYSGKLFRTTDGGESWALRNNYIGGRARSLFMLNQNYGLALIHDDLQTTAGNGHLIQTSNGGTSWDPVFSTNLTQGLLYNLTMDESRNIWAIGEHQQILKIEYNGLFEVNLSTNPVNIDVNVSGKGIYPQGTLVYINAEENDDYTFINWTGADADLLDYPNEAYNSFLMPDYDIELIANYDFPHVDTYLVEFSVYNDEEEVQGTISAKVNGAYIQSGEYLEEGVDIEFITMPADSYEIKQWLINGEVVLDGQEVFTDNNFTLYGLSEDIEVLVEFEETVSIMSFSDEVSIFPNPSNGIIFVENALNSDIYIYDLKGREVYTGLISDNYYLLNLSKFDTGVYIIKIQGKNNFVKRLLIK